MDISGTPGTALFALNANCEGTLFGLLFIFRSYLMLVAMSKRQHRRAEWKHPGKLKQYCTFAVLLPVYIPLLILLALWTLITRKPIGI